MADRANFDRIVTVECFEHMRNHDNSLLKCGNGSDLMALRLFISSAIKTLATLLKKRAKKIDGRTFSQAEDAFIDLFKQFNRDLEVTEQWKVNGRHYERTAELWRENLKEHRHNLENFFPICRLMNGLAPSPLASFFLACEETFGANNGDEWFVGHYRLAPK